MKSVRIEVFDAIKKKINKLDSYTDHNRGFIVLRHRKYSNETYNVYAFKVLSDHIVRKVEPVAGMKYEL